MGSIQVPHCHRCIQARSEATAANSTDDGACFVDDLSAFTYRGALLRQQAYAFTRNTGLLLGKDRCGTREATGTFAIGTTHLGDGPEQAGFDR
ncbi:hypothetical protein D3C73_1467290 [compost metagenome]